MNQKEFGLTFLGVDREKFKRIFSFVDFGNVNYWYERDERDSSNTLLPVNDKLIVDIEKLSDFLKIFSDHSRFYFGLDPQNSKSIFITNKARRCFDRALTKPIQHIKHYLVEDELLKDHHNVNEDAGGKYIHIPKCNFDVEICIDAVRMLNKFDTVCLLSGDADFSYLLDFLKRQKKKIILISSGYVSRQLKDKADLNINSQQIKSHITRVKQKPRL